MTYIAEGREGVADVPHRVGGEGDEGEVSGKRVPLGDKRGLSHPVPEDTQSFSFSSKHNDTEYK